MLARVPHVTYSSCRRARENTGHRTRAERDTQDSTDELTSDTTFITFGRRCLVP